MTDFARQELADLREYVPDTESCRVRLDSNESPFDLPSDLKEAVVAEIMKVPFNRYPQGLASELRTEIARYLALSPRQVILGNGLDEVIQMVLLAFGRGRKVVVARPSFSEYRTRSLIAGGIVAEVPMEDSLELDVSKVIKEAGRDRCVVLLCNPHNPSGSSVTREEIETVVRETESLVVVDEAYWEFSGETALPLVDTCDRIVILRTLSKAFGLAGVRVGYSVSSAEVASELLKVKQPFNMDCLSLTVARAAITNRRYCERTVRRITSERDRLYRRLSQMDGVTCYPSRANFILFRTAFDSDRVWRGMRHRGVAVRRFPGEPLLRRCLRVTCGAPEESDAFLEALEDVLNEERK